MFICYSSKRSDGGICFLQEGQSGFFFQFRKVVIIHISGSRDVVVVADQNSFLSIHKPIYVVEFIQLQRRYGLVFIRGFSVIRYLLGKYDDYLPSKIGIGSYYRRCLTVLRATPCSCFFFAVYVLPGLRRVFVEHTHGNSCHPPLHPFDKIKKKSI